MSNDKHSSAAPALGVAVGSACLVPEICEGQWLTIRGHRFHVNQICGETVYLRLERCNWDTPVPVADVIRALSSPNTKLTDAPNKGPSPER